MFGLFNNKVLVKEEKVSGIQKIITTIGFLNSVLILVLKFNSYGSQKLLSGILIFFILVWLLIPGKRSPFLNEVIKLFITIVSLVLLLNDLILNNTYQMDQLLVYVFAIFIFIIVGSIFYNLFPGSRKFYKS